ncbi:MAG: gamma-glutamyl-gamma-aminobutyrate hydrolase family protein [Tannerella sp.]|jgi:gamma-glutamyl-gamma-aminobutyrate hydrolase PuuD|nr:gamma-glutamyl-gamma-aminobutyrate hydrolase family protein [Tannerella sp.]
MKDFFISLILSSCLVGVVGAQGRAVIGISDTYRDGVNSAVPRTYVEAVMGAGGIPVIIPLIDDDGMLAEMLKSLDGVIFTGGEDFDPAYYGERPIPQMGKVNVPRDAFDLRLLRIAAAEGLPVLGICRGIQLINIAYGGSLYQDLSAQYLNRSVQHRRKLSKIAPTHDVVVVAGSVFSSIVGLQTIEVNSAHHQAVKDVAEGFSVVGRSTDGVIEAIEKVDSATWILGVQFHPEALYSQDEHMRNIFQYFVDKASHSKSKPMSASPRRKIELHRLQPPAIFNPELLKLKKVSLTFKAIQPPKKKKK